jgi:hypothetical protein
VYCFLSDVLDIGDCGYLLYSAKAIAALRDYLPLVFSGSDGLPESVLVFGRPFHVHLHHLREALP